MSQKTRAADEQRNRKAKPAAGNPYYAEVQRLVERVERAATDYESLGVGPRADAQEIKLAFQRSVSMLNPRYYVGNDDIDKKFLKRIVGACDKVSRAYSVLSAHAAGRKDEQAAPAPAPAVTQRQTEADNRRRTKRLKLCVPVHVSGYDRAGGKWDELTHTIDVSRTGVMLKLRRRVRHRLVLHIRLPLPLELRSHISHEQAYSVYAIVRRVEPPRKGERVVALEFLGEKPPAGFEEKPWATFRMKWAGSERRRKPREEKVEAVSIEYLDEDMQPIKRDDAVTENVGGSGARICLEAPPPEFDLVRVMWWDRKAECLAAATDRYFGKDGVERLCLRFLSSTTASKAGAEPEAATVAAVVAVAAAPKESTPARKKILVADDDPPLRKVLGKLLTDAGYEVVLAEDGRSAVEKARSDRPDLVLTDGLMPKLHGFLVCKAIKEFPSPPKVVILTAVYTNKKYRYEVRDQYGADDLLTKPFEVRDLLGCIERHLS